MSLLRSKCCETQATKNYDAVRLSESEPTLMRRNFSCHLGGHGAMRLCPPTEIRLVQPKDAVDGAQFGRLDQLGVRNGDGEQRAFELLLPEREKILQRREIRKQIVVLPDIGLQERGMIRHPIKNLCRRQPITQHLFPEILGNPNPRDHANLHCWSAFSKGAADLEPLGWRCAHMREM